jgi:hypothetical protein
MYYALIAVVAAVGLIVLGLMYLTRVTGGDYAGYAGHIQGIADRLGVLMGEFRGLHDGHDCPSKRRFRRHSWCPACTSKRAEMGALIRQIPKPLIAMGALAYYGHKFVAPVGRRQS